ncbi:TrmB family transcriptional regulator [Sneathia sanguinegens]|jgi:hypothetical protein|uniref:Helix-turn-helix domain-containing protein n=2 Tax=Sneathia sanguinegens TaxID=40543 RepID=A0ABT7HHG0_9FUSO|nr:helix-turn-helix domain-containing protein [Sneathia sanguinegens]MDK9579949.1 helix-turn-helix domain-containing protein [Sneathia sanguinegens]
MDKKGNMKLEDKLKAVGFNEVEAKVYLALLEKSGQNGTQLSKLLKLPRSSVYTALENLNERGIVYIIPTEKEYKNYNPIFPEDLVNMIKRKYIEILDTLAEDFDKIYDKKKYEMVYNIDGLTNIRYKLEEMIQDSKESILISGYIKNMPTVDKDIRYINENDVDQFVCLVDKKKILIAKLNALHEVAIYTNNSLIIEQFLKGIK